MPKRFETELELHEIDLRSLRPEQRGAVIELAKARAHEERSGAFHAAFRAIGAWFRRKDRNGAIKPGARLPLGAILGRS
jgi:hypothetical protein